MKKHDYKRLKSTKFASFFIYLYIWLNFLVVLLGYILLFAIIIAGLIAVGGILVKWFIAGNWAIKTLIIIGVILALWGVYNIIDEHWN